MPKNRFASQCLTLVVLLSLLLPIASCMKPVPLSPQARRAQVDTDLQNIFMEQDPITHPLDIYDVIARAIKYNLNHRLKRLQQALAQAETTVASLEMLPRLAATAGYTYRDRRDASNSLNLSTGVESQDFTTSDDQGMWNGDLTMTWNVLDFTLSYFQAQQSAQQELVWQERTRKVVQSLIQDVIGSYWRAAGAEQLRPRVERVLADAEAALANIRTVAEERLEPPLRVLQREKALMQTIQQMQTILDDLNLAKPVLASLMNMSPGSAFEIEPVDLEGHQGTDVETPVEDLELLALQNRPELLEAAYEESASRFDIYKAIAELAPDLSASVGQHFTSNSFARYGNWWQVGMNVSWNLMNTLSFPAKYARAEYQQEASHMQRLALSMAVLSQVHVSNIQYHSMQKRYEQARHMFDIENRILGHVSDGVESRSMSAVDLIQSEANAIRAELAMYDSFASLEKAQGQIFATLGLDPIGPLDQDMSVEEMARIIEQSFVSWRQGQFAWTDPAQTPE